MSSFSKVALCLVKELFFGFPKFFSLHAENYGGDGRGSNPPIQSSPQNQTLKPIPAGLASRAGWLTPVLVGPIPGWVGAWFHLRVTQDPEPIDGYPKIVQLTFYAPDAWAALLDHPRCVAAPPNP